MVESYHIPQGKRPRDVQGEGEGCEDELLNKVAVESNCLCVGYRNTFIKCAHTHTHTQLTKVMRCGHPPLL